METIVKKQTEQGKSYWNNDGAYTDLFDKIWEEEVPKTGESKTVDGELVRCFGRLNYDWGNNGNCNVINYNSYTEEVEHDCSNCYGEGYLEGEWDEDIEDYEQVTCDYCEGTGVETEVEEYYDDVYIDSYYKDIIEFLKNNMTEPKYIYALEDYLLHSNNPARFDEKEYKLYNDLGDAIGFQIEQRTVESYE